MSREYCDFGVILKKRFYKDNLYRVSIFSKNSGKIVVWAYGVKKITSRRISHLEIGNYIKFTYRKGIERFTLEETELVTAYSKIKESFDKIKDLYLVLFVLEKLLPENFVEDVLYCQFLSFLKELNNGVSGHSSRRRLFLITVLQILGYTNDTITGKDDFSPEQFIGTIINENLDKRFK
jgi:DNA repair protein RecO